MRDLTTEMSDELQARNMLPAQIVQMEFDSGTLYMWSGNGTLTWDGNDYIGGGNLVSVSSMEETQNIEAKGVICTLNGIPSTLVALALTERTRGRPMRMWLGCIDSSTAAGNLLLEDGDDLLLEDGDTILLENDALPPNTLIVSPQRTFTGQMDVMEVSDSGDDAFIRLSVESNVLTAQRAKISRYTAVDQKKTYPLDKGLDNINQLIDREVVW